MSEITNTSEMSEQEQNRATSWMLISTANASLAPVNIKGKDYIQVNQRIKAFRYCYPKGTIKTTIISQNEEEVMMEAEIFDEDGRLLANGHAWELKSSSYINKTSYIENCETSAIGRALGMCGFGIDTSVASAEEVETAQAQQENDKKATVNMIGKLKLGYPEEAIKQICKKVGITDINDLPRGIAEKLIADRKDIITQREKEGKAEAKAMLESEPLPFY